MTGKLSNGLNAKAAVLLIREMTAKHFDGEGCKELRCQVCRTDKLSRSLFVTGLVLKKAD